MQTNSATTAPALRLVEAAPIERQAPRVFSASMIQRLSFLTAAEREVRAMGMQVTWTKLAGPVPQIHLTRGEASMGNLLGLMKNKVFADCDEGGYKTVRGDFMGCSISWLEPL